MATEFDIQGHRGARGLAPENTLVGFARALEVGVNSLEFDVGVTKDEVVVVTHNYFLEPELTRFETGKWLTERGPAINSLTFHELSRFDVGKLNPAHIYSTQFPYQVSSKGVSIPSLSEVFELVEYLGATDIEFNIEIKMCPDQPGLTPTPQEFVLLIMRVIDQYGLREKVVLSSFDWRPLQVCNQIDNKIRTSYLTVQQSWLNNIRPYRKSLSPWLAGFDIMKHGGCLPTAIKKAGGNIWAAFCQEITYDQIKRAHNLGILVKVWTVNDKTQMKLFFDMGVDGIITDYPDVLINMIKNK